MDESILWNTGNRWIHRAEAGLEAPGAEGAGDEAFDGSVLELSTGGGCTVL